MQDLKEAFPTWFSPDTMAFFDCTIMTDLIDSKYFITKEKKGFRSTSYAYTVREATDTGIETKGGFQTFSDLDSAERFVDSLVKENA